MNEGNVALYPKALNKIQQILLKIDVIFLTTFALCPHLKHFFSHGHGWLKYLYCQSQRYILNDFNKFFGGIQAEFMISNELNAVLYSGLL